MAPTPNPIDLTTYQNVEAWGNDVTPGKSVSVDQQVQDVVTAFSAWVLKFTGRGPADGSIPATSPFVIPTSYDEFYDGNGNDTLPIRNWPITAVSSVNAQGIIIPASTGLSSPGYVIDQSKKFIVLRYGGTPYAFGANYRGPRWACGGWPLGTQNIEIQYTAGFSGIPFDLEMLARKVCALKWKQQDWLGQRSKAMAAGAGTISFDRTNFDDIDWATLMYYQARVA